MTIGTGGPRIAQKPDRQAVAYALRRIKTLSLYTTDGRLEIDNNLIENTIRPIALGRKNYLFVGSHAAAQSIAIFYSLLGSFKLHDIEPYAYLKDILERLPTIRSER